PRSTAPGARTRLVPLSCSLTGRSSWPSADSATSRWCVTTTDNSPCTTAASGPGAAVGVCPEVTYVDHSYRNLTGLTRLRQRPPAIVGVSAREALRSVQARHDQPLPVAWGRACLAHTEGI